jgi:hypothetical protein
MHSETRCIELREEGKHTLEGIGHGRERNRRRVGSEKVSVQKKKVG